MGDFKFIILCIVLIFISGIVGGIFIQKIIVDSDLRELQLLRMFLEATAIPVEEVPMYFMQYTERNGVPVNPEDMVWRPIIEFSWE